MLLIDKIAEATIKEAQVRGEFDNLPGSGQPITLDDDSAIPQERRMAYRVLKNAGYKPAEIEMFAVIRRLEGLLQQSVVNTEKSKLVVKLGLLRSQLSKKRGC